MSASVVKADIAIDIFPFTGRPRLGRIDETNPILEELHFLLIAGEETSGFSLVVCGGLSCRAQPGSGRPGPHCGHVGACGPRRMSRRLVQ
jgi:hypothetical protein